jgi:hypothetical protein
MESMEGRLMLSAASLAADDVAAMEASDVLSVGLNHSIDAASNAQMVRLETIEGGYISVQRIDNTHGVHGTTLNFDADGFDSVFTMGVADYLHPGVQLEFANFGDAELSPIRFNAIPTSLVQNSLEATAAQGHIEGLSFEGGSIPIETLRPGGEPFSTSIASASLAAAIGTNSAATVHGVPAVASARVSPAVSSETARAIVFAITGGEPDHGARIVTARRGTPHETPSNATTPVDSPHSQASPSATPGTESVSSVLRVRDFAAHKSQDRLGLRNARGSDSHPHFQEEVIAGGLQSKESTQQTLGGDAIHATESRAAVAQLNPTSLSLVFELDDVDLATPSGDASGSVISTTLAATPLLVVWALERIATTNSRRATHNSPASGPTPSTNRRVGRHLQFLPIDRTDS